MKLRKYVLVGILAACVLAMAGCGNKDKGKEAASGAATGATQENGEEGRAEAASGSTEEEALSDDEEFTGAWSQVLGEKGAALMEQTSKEELAALIPETAVPVEGYCQYYSMKEEGRASADLEGYMKEYEVIEQDWECVTAQGIVASEALQTETPITVVYFYSINEDETAVQLTSPAVKDAPEDIHVIPTIPFPEAEELLDFGLNIEVEISAMLPREKIPFTRENVSEIWYDEDVLQRELTDRSYWGTFYYILNGFEHMGHINLDYLAYDDPEAPAGWTVDNDGNWVDVVHADETGMEWAASESE